MPLRTRIGLSQIVDVSLPVGMIRLEPTLSCTEGEMIDIIRLIALNVLIFFSTVARSLLVAKPTSEAMTPVEYSALTLMRHTCLKRHRYKGIIQMTQIYQITMYDELCDRLAVVLNY